MRSLFSYSLILYGKHYTKTAVTISIFLCNIISVKMRLPKSIIDQVKECKKDIKLRYKLVTRRSAKMLEKPMTLIPFSVYSTLLLAADNQNKDVLIDTVLPGDPKPEQTFSLKSLTKEKNQVLVVGPVGEIYHANINKFRKVRGTVNMYAPMSEMRQCLELTPAIYAALSAKLSKNNPNYFEFNTSWGATHIAMPGDFIIIENNQLGYRVHRQVFLSTYTSK